VLKADLSEYRLLHFATHGLIDANRPELSALALSMVDENGVEQNGYLRAQDLFNLKLNADLVVLSACETALGRQLRGEGLIGLTQGFMRAGVPRVVVSLWSVDDAATAELMTRFYRKLSAKNQSPAASLRQAQLEMLQQKNEPRWHSPYYWAPFILIGNWK
jgi:CHAT domain-containing protein